MSSTPTRPVRVFFVFLIFSSLTARCFPRADQMNCVGALGEHYHEQAAPVRLAEQHQALLVLRVPRVVGDAAKWITEDRNRFLKRDFVPRAITGCLPRVPLEPQVTGQLSVLGGGVMSIASL